MWTDDARSRDVVVGLGNPLMGDDGLGLAALERLRDEWELPPEVELVDGGTWGMNLLPMIESARRLLLLDAIRTGMPPGSECVLARDEIPRFLATKLSPHQIDLREVLAIAELRGTLPEETLALGLEPARVELGDRLSPRVEAKIDRLVDLAIDQLQRWGHTCRPQRRYSADANA
jgi:hydrogenase maturation protease